MIKVRNYKILTSGFLLALTCCSFAGANDDVEPLLTDALESMIHESDEKATTTLSDRVHQIARSLESEATIHSYSFTSVRGQNVLLATPVVDGFNRSWKVEYRQGNGDWIVKTYRGPQLFTALQPGTMIDVRVSAVASADWKSSEYHLVFGSSPRTNYDLHNEEGLLPIPYGLTKPGFLATQAFKQSLLDVTVTDSKGHPLEGGVVYFELELPHVGDPIEKTLVSGANGKAQELLKFGPCVGGNAAGYFVHKHNGRNTWATRYKLGKYMARNVLLEDLANKPHIYDFGHICKRTLVNWSRN